MMLGAMYSVIFSGKKPTIALYFGFSDMIGRRNLRTRNIKMFILDEADEMLNKGNMV